MMQAAPLDHVFSARIVSAITVDVPSTPQGPASLAPSMGLSGLSPAMMAVHLLRANPVSARCFAQAMYEGSAWANDEWGDYWASVVSLV